MQRYEDGDFYVKCACGGKKRASAEDLLEGEEMLMCDACCRRIRLIFTIENLNSCLRIIRTKEELETGNISVIIHKEEDSEVGVRPPPRTSSLKPPPRTSSLNPYIHRDI